MKTWNLNEGDYYRRGVSREVPFLPKAVFDLQQSPLGELYLKELSQEFTFDFKVYGLETEFIKKVKKTYTNTSGNLGVMLNGIKGTGKTITAEILANTLEQPVIIVGASFPGLNDFLTDINQNITVFIDEYEKIFKGNISEDDYNRAEQLSADGSLLSIMDGVYKTEWRKVFILTTNHLWINENLINRPGRIRYMKSFSDLKREQIEEIMTDCLKDKKWKEGIYDFMKPLELITVDIVKAIISEVNIFNEEPSKCCKDLNLTFREDKYGLYRVSGKKEEKIEGGIDARVALHILSSRKNTWRGRYIATENQEYYLTEPPNSTTGTMKVSPDNFTDTKGSFTVKLKKEIAVHSSFIY